MVKIAIDKADRLFSKWIRSRDEWTCQRCSKRYNPPTSALHCSHFMGRGKEATRFEPLNCDAMCYGCHIYLTAHPAEHYEWQLAKKGKKLVDSLVLLSNTYKKKDRKLEAIYWKQKLKEDFGI